MAILIDPETVVRNSDGSYTVKTLNGSSIPIPQNTPERRVGQESSKWDVKVIYKGLRKTHGKAGRVSKDSRQVMIDENLTWEDPVTGSVYGFAFDRVTPMIGQHYAHLQSILGARYLFEIVSERNEQDNTEQPVVSL